MTSRIRKRALTWLLTGTAFVTGIVASAGCSDNNGYPTSRTDGPTTRPVDSPAPEMTPAASFELVGGRTGETPTPPRVNIFGEFDGIPHAALRNGGESGYQQHTY